MSPLPHVPYVSDHLRVVLAAPEEHLDGVEAAARWTRLLGRPGADDTPGGGCGMPLHPVQGEALETVHRAVSGYYGTAEGGRALDVEGLPWGPRGLLAPIGVGHGKTLITFLLPEVVRRILGRCRSMLVVPPDLVQKTRIDFAHAVRHYRMGQPNVVSMGILSHKNHSAIFERMKPDLIMVDEAHYLASMDSSRTKRLIRWVRDHRDTICVFLSGTITSKSIRDYRHLALLALRDLCPLPESDDELELWQSLIDVSGEPNAAAHAELLSLVNWHLRRAGREEVTRGRDVTKELARDAYRERLISLPGVVATDGTGCEASLVIRPWRVELPPSWQEALSAFDLDGEDATWEMPDDTEIVDALSAARARFQIASGYYTRWVWPERACPGVWTPEYAAPCKGPTCPLCEGTRRYSGPDAEWMERRRAWSAAERSILKNFEQKTGQDSPALVRDLSRAGRFGGTARRTLAAWEGVMGRYYTEGIGHQPPVEYVNLDPGPEWLAARAREWTNKVKRGLIWYATPHVGDALAAAGFRVYGAGTRPPPDRSAHPALKIDVHGTGKNFQAWDHNLVLEFRGNARVWEQKIGRTHRMGQTSDEVRFDVIMDGGVRTEYFHAARLGSAYIQRTTGMTQRLQICTVADPCVGPYRAH